jgi:hypothetical protein
MLNLVQISERLKGMPLQAVMQYANGTNPEVPPYIALGELQRRKKMEQDAQQSAAMQQNPQQQPTVKQGIEQALRPPAPPPEAQGVASLPAPNMAQGFANGGIVAFDGGGRVERYQGLERSLVGGPRMNISGRLPEDRSLFEENSPFRSNQKSDRELLQELEAKIANGTATPSEIRRARGLRAVLLGNVGAAPNVPSYEQDIAGPDFTFRNRPAAIPSPAGTPSAAAATPSPQRALGGQSQAMEPNVPVTSPQELVQNQMMEANAAPGTDAIAAFNPANYQPRTLKDIIEGRRTALKDMGITGLGGEEEENRLKKMQEEYKKQQESAGLGNLANALSAYAAAPRKRALGAAAQALGKGVASQRAEERNYNMAMNQMQSAIERGRRAEAIELVKGASAELEKEKELASTERREAIKIAMQDKWQTMDDKTRREISEASLQVQERIAKMPPAEFRTLQLIAQQTGRSILDILQARRGNTASGVDEDTLVREYNKAKQTHMENPRTRDKPFPDYADWKKQYVGGATGASGQRVIDFGKI